MLNQVDRTSTGNLNLNLRCGWCVFGDGVDAFPGFSGNYLIKCTISFRYLYTNESNLCDDVRLITLPYPVSASLSINNIFLLMGFILLSFDV